jgi:hypothetical protein
MSASPASELLAGLVAFLVSLSFASTINVRCWCKQRALIA